MHRTQIFIHNAYNTKHIIQCIEYNTKNTIQRNQCTKMQSTECMHQISSKIRKEDPIFGIFENGLIFLKIDDSGR